MEMPSCLRELLQEKENLEDGVQRYFDFISSKANISAIRCYGKPILPPLLSDNEKSQMREYRRSAVKLEQKLFEARREKYSSLLLQVMEIMDRIKEREEGQGYTAPYYEGQRKINGNIENKAGKVTRSDGVLKISEVDTNKAVPQSSQRGQQQFAAEKDRKDLITSLTADNNYNRSDFTATSGSFPQQTSLLSSSSSYKSSSSYIPSSAHVRYDSRAADSTGSKSLSRDKDKHLNSQNSTPQDGYPNDTRDQTLTAEDNINGDADSTIASTLHGMQGPLLSSTCVSGSTKGSVISHVDSSIASGTTTSMDQSLMSQVSAACHGGSRGVDDSLASTNLSLAFTDSSMASLHSTVDPLHQPMKSAQRQLQMDTINNNLYQSYQRQVNHMPLSTSTPTTDHPPTRLKHTSKAPVIKSGKNVSGGKGSSNRAPASSQTHKVTTTDQDKALEKLEMMRQKLIHEKEKQLQILRKQELARLRKKSGRTPVVAEDSSDEDFENATDLRQRRNFTRTNSDVSTMYAIAEGSFEGSMSEKYSADAESTSDKENRQHWMPDNEDLHGHHGYGNYGAGRHDDGNYGVGHHGDGAGFHGDGNYGDGHHGDINYGAGHGESNYGVDHHGDNHYSDGHRSNKGNKIWESYSHALGRDQQSSGNGSKYRSHLYVRQEFVIQLEMLISQGGAGLEKFTILTASAKGFLTRRLLQADKIQAIIKTIKDTRDFLADISKEGTRSLQEKSLQARVQAQLDAARGKLHDIFFKIPVTERMSYLEHSRNLAKERETRQNDKAGKADKARRLSSATVKAMQRRQDGQQGSADPKKPSTASSPLGKRKSWDIRVLKPTQSHKSPTLADKSRYNLRKQRGTRPGTAPPTRQVSSRKSLGGRPSTAHETRTTSSATNATSRAATQAGQQQTRRPGRTSREEKIATKRPTRVSLEEKARPQRPSRTSLEEKAGPKKHERSRSEERVPPESGTTSERAPPRRPLRMSLGNRQQPSLHQVTAVPRGADNTNENKPINGPTTRKVARKLAARFNK